jgi:N utilization substance protein A
MAISANRLELLQIADAVAREKSIDRMIVINAMEDAIQKAARSRYGTETEVRAEINPKTGDIRLQRLLQVVETVENVSTEISLDDAAARNPEAGLGDFIAEPLPPLDFGRIAAQSAKQVIVQKFAKQSVIVSMTNSRTVLAKSSTGLSSGPNTATSLSISAGAKELFAAMS